MKFRWAFIGVIFCLSISGLTFHANAEDDLGTVAFWYRDKADVIWGNTPEILEQVKALKEDPARFQNFQKRAGECVNGVEKAWSGGKTGPADYNVKYQQAIAKCVQDTYTVNGLRLARWVRIFMEQCPVEMLKNGGLAVSGFEAPRKDAGVDEESVFEKTGCHRWAVPFSVWIHLKNTVQEALLDFENVVKESREDSKLAGAFFGALVGFVIGDRLGTSAGELDVAVNGTSFPVAKGDLSPVTDPLGLVVAGFSAAAGYFIVDKLSQYVSFKVHAGTIQAFRDAFTVFKNEDADLLLRIGRFRTAYLGNTFLSDLRAAFPVPLEMVDEPIDIDPSLYWWDFKKMCRDPKYVAVERITGIRKLGDMEDYQVSYRVVDFGNPLCGFAFKKLSGFLILIGIEGRQLPIQEEILKSGVNILMAGLNFISGLINAAENGHRPTIDNGIAKFTPMLDLKTCRPVEDRQGGFGFARKPTCDLQVVIPRDSPVFGEDTIRLLKSAVGRGTATMAGSFFRPQRFDSNSSEDQNKFAISVLKSFGFWFASSFIEPASSPTRMKPSVSDETVGKFLAPYFRLADALGAHNPLNVRNALAALVKSTVHLQEEKLRKVYDETLAGDAEIRKMAELYVATRKKTGQQFSDYDLFRDMMRVLQAIKTDLQQNFAKGREVTVMGTTDTEFGGDLWPHALDPWWATMAFPKADQIRDRAFAGSQITPNQMGR